MNGLFVVEHFSDEECERCFERKMFFVKFDKIKIMLTASAIIPASMT